MSIWGTGCSPYAGRPGSGPRLPFSPRADTAFDIAAARGPYTARLLTGGALPEVAMGDPALLLPRFHDRPVAPRYELGVVLHLAELADRTYEAHPAAGLVRYHGLPAAIDVPWDGQDAVGGARRVFASGAAGAGDRVALITMVTAPDAMSIADRVDTLRACRRIVSTSLHGIALALAYGIPCLYLASTAGPVGPGEAALDPSGVDLPEGLNPRFPDLYAGLGFSRMPFWRQPKAMPTDWNAVICAIDAMADPAVGLARCSGEMGDALAATCPAGVAGLHAVSVGRAGPSARSLDANSDVRSIPFMGRARASRSTAAAAMATP
ncbi:MAG: polysaccharide pyruvyl transferase family protein [Pseudomonadota bacterium]